MKRNYHVGSYVVTFIFALALGISMCVPADDDVPVKITCKPWFYIPIDLQKRLSERYVSVAAGKLQGSGCRIKPGYYLTALHILGDDPKDVDIAVNGQKATLVSDPDKNPGKDIVVVSTFAEINFNEGRLDPYNSFEDNQDVIVVGAPGTWDVSVQPAKILKPAVDENHNIKEGSKVISAQYIELGISGGCVYSADGLELLGVVTKKYGTKNSVGEVTFATMNVE